MIKDLASHLIGQFSDCLRAKLAESGAAAGAPDIAPRAASAPPDSASTAAKPISGFALIFRILWQAFLRLFSRRS
jgi:hypothetical protein